MKRLVFTCCLLVMVMTMGAQRYMRYHMNDGTFNGFYTDCVDSILHSMDLTQVYANGQVYEIPLANVDSVTFEGVDLATDADNMVGRYRIYELDTLGFNIPFKKAYFDNRAMLVNSETGDFGIHDRIMIHSDFYDCSLLISINGYGDIRYISDGNYLLNFQYREDGSYTVDLFEAATGDSILLSKHFPVNILEKYSISRGLRDNIMRGVTHGLRRVFREFDDEMFDRYTDALDAFGDLLNNIDEIGNNPEWHNERILFGSIQVFSDLVGVISLVGGSVVTGGALATLAVTEIANLQNDLYDLCEEIIVPVERLQMYEWDYKERYEIHIYMNDVTNITENSATLSGTVCTADGLIGTIYFKLDDWDNTDKRMIEAKIVSNENDYKYTVAIDVNNLNPDKLYFYDVIYKCRIDGVNLVYDTDTVNYFRTKPEPLWTCPDDNHPHAIDLGLPSGAKWACCNVGATSPEEYGGFYAWGETEEKEYYNRENYIYDGIVIGKKKYYEGYYYFDISKTQYDVARVKWGDDWHMPIKTEVQELINNCSMEWVDYTDYLDGLLVTGPNGNSIFLKNACYKDYLTWGGGVNFHIAETQYGYEGVKLQFFMMQKTDKRASVHGISPSYMGFPVRPVKK